MLLWHLATGIPVLLNNRPILALDDRHRQVDTEDTLDSAKAIPSEGLLLIVDADLYIQSMDRRRRSEG